MYKRIRDLREDKDLNQTAVAEMLGMSQTGYSKYETGENDIPICQVKPIVRKDILKNKGEGADKIRSFYIIPKILSYLFVLLA